MGETEMDLMCVVGRLVEYNAKGTNFYAELDDGTGHFNVLISKPPDSHVPEQLKDVKLK